MTTPDPALMALAGVAEVADGLSTEQRLALEAGAGSAAVIASLTAAVSGWRAPLMETRMEMDRRGLRKESYALTLLGNSVLSNLRARKEPPNVR